MPDRLLEPVEIVLVLEHASAPKRFVNPRMEDLGHTDSLGVTAENLAQARYAVSAEIERLSGSHFDPGLVAAFMPIAAELHAQWFGPESAASRELTVR